MTSTIGILGGMGPRATVTFEKMLIDKFLGKDQSIPKVITLNDGSIPDRTDFLTQGGPDPVPFIQRNLTVLELMGASIICIPCNTACMPKIFGRLNSVSSEIIDLPLSVIDRVLELNIKSVCLLATEGTISQKQYQNLFKINSINCLLPSETLQRQVSRVIKFVKTGEYEEAIRISAKIKRSLAKLNFEALILACTELPLIAEHIVPDSVLMLDTLEVLASSCVYKITNLIRSEV